MIIMITFTNEDILTGDPALRKRSESKSYTVSGDEQFMLEVTGLHTMFSLAAWAHPSLTGNKLEVSK